MVNNRYSQLKQNWAFSVNTEGCNYLFLQSCVNLKDLMYVLSLVKRNSSFSISLPSFFLPFPLFLPCASTHNNRVVLSGGLQVEQKSRCCQEQSSERRIVTVHCADLTARLYSYKHVTSCECRSYSILR